MQSARVTESVTHTTASGSPKLGAWLRGASRSISARLSWLRVGFALSLAAYFVVRLLGIVIDVPPMADLTILPAGVCAVGLGLHSRLSTTAEARDHEDAESSGTQGLLAGGLLLAFTVTYLALNTVPMVTSEDESAIVNGGHALATEHSLRAISPLNDQYHTNIFGALHVMYRTPGEMYYRAFAGSVAIYAPFSLLPVKLGYHVFAVTFGTLAVLALYAIAWKLLRSWQAGFIAGAAFVTSPVLGLWAVTVFNNVPALALELTALAVIVWARREKPWQFALAGLLMGLAYFVRWTEAVYIVPLLAVAWWRTRGWPAPAAFFCASATGGALILATNHIFYGHAFFSPYAGSQHLTLPGFFPDASFQGVAAPDLSKTYKAYSFTSTNLTSISQIRLEATNIFYHARFLASSIFAFPFLSIALTGIAWRLASGRRASWALAGGVGLTTVIIVIIYGRLSHNYYGYGLAIVRSSFVRYSLMFYALMSIAAAAFLVDTIRSFSAKTLQRASFAVLVGAVCAVGIAQSYDSSVYGFDKLNTYRDHDEQAWSDIKALLDSRPTKPVLVVGPTGEKLIDRDYEKNTINIDMLPLLYRAPALFPVLQQASNDRDVYIALSDSFPSEQAFRLELYQKYRPRPVLHTNGFTVFTLDQRPQNFLLSGIDIWSTFDAVDRWQITPEGYLRSTTNTSYFQFTDQIDKDGDGRVDHDVVLRVQLFDQSARRQFTISGLDSRSAWQPVPLFQGTFTNSGRILTYDIDLQRGQYIGNTLVVSPEVTFVLLAVVPPGS